MILGGLGATIRGLLLAASPDMVIQPPKITQLYLSCLVAWVLKFSLCHGHQNYGPQLLGWSQAVRFSINSALIQFYIFVYCICILCICLFVPSIFPVSHFKKSILREKS